MSRSLNYPEQLKNNYSWNYTSNDLQPWKESVYEWLKAKPKKKLHSDVG
jgi:hypothetical protein